MRKRLKLILLFIFLIFISSTSNAKIRTGKLRGMEKDDHKKCSFMIEDFYNHNENELYWRCRVKVLNERIYEARESEESFELQDDLIEIKPLLENRILQAKNAKVAKAQKNLWAIEHQICILKNSDVKSENFSKEYNDCRELLLINRTPVVPFARGSYRFSNEDIQNPQDLEKIISENALDQKTELTLSEQAKVTSLVVEMFPTCGRYNVKSDKFKDCVKRENEAKKCRENIPMKIKNRQLEDKMFCEKKAVKDYPDNLVLYGIQEEKETETKKAEEKKDGLSALLGIKKDGSEVEKKEKKEQKVEAVDINFGPKFSKQEVMKLRNKSYDECIKEREKKLREYRKSLPEKCDEIKTKIKEKNLN